MASNPNARAAARLRLERNNDIVNLIVRRETARVDFWEAQTLLDQKLLGVDVRYRELATQLQEIYQTSMNAVPRPEVSSDEEPDKELESEKRPPPKKRKKSKRQIEKSRERLKRLKEKKRKQPEEDEEEEEIPFEEDLEEVEKEEEPVKKPKRNKVTGRETREEDAERRDQAALDKQLVVRPLAVNKKGEVPAWKK